MAMTVAPLNVLPAEVWCYVGCFLERGDLARCEQVSQGWKTCFSSHIPWYHLFVRTFREETSSAECKEAFKERWGIQLVDSSRLLTAATEFWMRSPLGEPKKMVIFSNPDCTTGKLHSFYLEYADCLKEGQVAPLIRTCYFRYPGEVFADHTDSVGRINGAGASNELKHTTIVSNQNTGADEAVECRIEMAPGVCRDLKVHGADCINALNHLHPYTLCLWAKIPLDLPSGECLGVISSVDNWEKPTPLKLICDETGLKIFTGFVPYGNVRFVKLCKDGAWIPEVKESRILTQPQDLNTSLSTSPIQFPM
jgi:hypothetical protein